MTESSSANNYFANLEKYREATMSQMDMYRENAIQQINSGQSKMKDTIEEVQKAGAGITATGMAMKAVSKKLPDSMWKGQDNFVDSRGTSYTSVSDYVSNQRLINPNNFNPFEGQRQSLSKQINSALKDNGDRPTGALDNTNGFSVAEHSQAPRASAPRDLTPQEFNGLNMEDKLSHIGVNPNELQTPVGGARLEEINDILRGKGSTEFLADKEPPSTGAGAGGGAGDPKALEATDADATTSDFSNFIARQVAEGKISAGDLGEALRTRGGGAPEPAPEGALTPTAPVAPEASYQGATPSITITEPQPETTPLRLFGAEGSGQRVGQVEQPAPASETIQEASGVGKPSVEPAPVEEKPINTLTDPNYEISPELYSGNRPLQPQLESPFGGSLERPTTRPAELDQAQTQIQSGVDEAKANLQDIQTKASGALDDVADTAKQGLGDVFENEGVGDLFENFSAEAVGKGMMSSLGIDASMIGAGGELVGASLLLGGLAQELISGKKAEQAKQQVADSATITGSAVGGANIQGFGEQGVGTGGIV